MSPARSSRRWVTVAGSLALLVGGAMTAPNAQAETLRFNYVAASGVYNGFDALVYRQPTPVGAVAPGGHFRFRSSSTAFTLEVDDAASLDGTAVPVLVAQQFPNGSHSESYACVPVRTTISYASSNGAAVIVLVASEMYWFGMPSYDLHCSGRALAGSVLVGL
ncbi:MAG: hypothetical protein ACT452_17160 [Microthrixaceae bacterium]